MGKIKLEMVGNARNIAKLTMFPTAPTHSLGYGPVVQGSNP